MSKLKILIESANRNIMKYFNYKSLVDRSSGEYPIDPLTHVPKKYHQIVRDVINAKISVQTYESHYLPELADYYVCNIGITRAIYKVTNYQFKNSLEKYRINTNRIKQVSVSDIESGNSSQYLKESFSIDFVSRNRSYIRRFINSKYGVQLFPDALTNEILERSPDVLMENRLLELGIKSRTGGPNIDLKTGKPISIKKNVLDSVSKAGGKDIVAPDINEFSDLMSKNYEYEVKLLISGLSDFTDIIGKKRVSIFEGQLEGHLKLIDKVDKNCETIDQFLGRGSVVTRTDLERFSECYRGIEEDFSLGLDRSYRFTKYSAPEFFIDEFGKQPVRIFTDETTEFDIMAKFVETLRVLKPLSKDITFRLKDSNILESYVSFSRQLDNWKKEMSKNYENQVDQIKELAKLDPNNRIIQEITTKIKENAKKIADSDYHSYDEYKRYINDCNEMSSSISLDTKKAINSFLESKKIDAEAAKNMNEDIDLMLKEYNDNLAKTEEKMEKMEEEGFNPDEYYFK
jgi:hypothetical protein